MRVRFTRSARSILAATVVVAGTAGSLFAAAASGTAPDPLPGDARFVDLAAAWAAATGGGRPLDTGVLECARKVASGQSCVDGGGAIVGRAPDGGQVVTFPIAGMDVRWASEVRRRAFAHQVFLSGVNAATASLVGDGGPAELLQLPEWTLAANLELFVAEALFFFEADALEDKCLHYGRLTLSARLLGWGEGGALGDAGAPRLPAAWLPLHDAARGLFAQAFAKGSATAVVPDSVCGLARPQTKEEEEAIARSIVDDALLARLEAEAQDTIEGKVKPLLNSYSKALSEFTLAIPTEETLALRKAVEAAVTNYAYVSADPLALVTPHDHGETLTARVREAGARAQDILRDASPAAPWISAGKSKKGEHLAVLRALVVGLKGVASKDAGALSSASQKGLAACGALDENEAPNEQGLNPNGLPDGGASYLQRLDRCLSGVALAYTELRRGTSSRPDHVKLAEEITDLSTRYIDFVSP